MQQWEVLSKSYQKGKKGKQNIKIKPVRKMYSLKFAFYTFYYIQSSTFKGFICYIY